jgi:hypothetical protein
MSQMATAPGPLVFQQPDTTILEQSRIPTDASAHGWQVHL